MLRDLHDCAVCQHLVIGLLDLVPELFVAELESDRVLLLGDFLVKDAELIGVVLHLVLGNADINGDRVHSACLHILEAGIVAGIQLKVRETCAESRELFALKSSLRRGLGLCDHDLAGQIRERLNIGIRQDTHNRSV